MSTQVATQTQNRGQGHRGRRGNRGRGGRGRGGKAAPQSEQKDVTLEVAEQTEQVEKAEEKATATTPAEEDDENLCWICAEPVKYWSVSECNHRTCHVCALRLRALYKKLECTFCKVSVQLLVARRLRQCYAIESSSHLG